MILYTVYCSVFFFKNIFVQNRKSIDVLRVVVLNLGFHAALHIVIVVEVVLRVLVCCL